MVTNRSSSDECRESRIVPANGSPNTVDALSNETPCLTRFSAAFSVSHSNSTSHLTTPATNSDTGTSAGRARTLTSRGSLRSPRPGQVQHHHLCRASRPRPALRKATTTSRPVNVEQCDKATILGDLHRPVVGCAQRAGSAAGASNASPGPLKPEVRR